MTELELERFEESVTRTTRGFVYPRTPVLRRTTPIEMRRNGFSAAASLRLAMIVAVLALGVSLLAVPSVRAAVVRFLQIGVVRIEVVQPTPMAAPSPAPATTQTPTATPKPLADQLDLFGKTTLTNARASGLSINVPVALGQPDAVYLQDVGGSMAVLVWFDVAQPGKVRISLQVFSDAAFVRKMSPKVLRTTRVKDREAAWVQGEHVLKVKSGDYEVVQLVSANALIWTEGRQTYRLETSLTMDEAVRIAETTP